MLCSDLGRLMYYASKWRWTMSDTFPPKKPQAIYAVQAAATSANWNDRSYNYTTKILLKARKVHSSTSLLNPIAWTPVYIDPQMNCAAHYVGCLVIGYCSKLKSCSANYIAGNSWTEEPRAPYSYTSCVADPYTTHRTANVTGKICHSSK